MSKIKISKEFIADFDVPVVSDAIDLMTAPLKAAVVKQIVAILEFAADDISVLASGTVCEFQVGIGGNVLPEPVFKRIHINRMLEPIFDSDPKTLRQWRDKFAAVISEIDARLTEHI